MQTALITTVQIQINTWVFPTELGEQGSWQMVTYPVNSIINFIVANDSYIPPVNTLVMSVADTAQIGDVVDV